MAPGGMALPNTISKTTASQLTYFFYHTRLNTIIGKKLDASITFLQIKFGAFPFCQYGPLGTNTIIKAILGETEPNNLQLHTSPETAWMTSPQGNGDRALMEIALQQYSTKECKILLFTIS
jgi:hypothetical protein